MILAGMLLTGAGSLATAFFLLAHDTSVDGGFGDRVHNIGLQQTRTLGVQAGLVAVGAGVVLFAAGMVVYSLAKMGRERWQGTTAEDLLLLDRQAAETGSALADLARRYLEPLLKTTGG